MSNTARIAAALLAFGFAQPAAAAEVALNTGAAGHCTPENVCYVGHWEFVSSRFDGRYGGHSARSFRRGDNLSLEFTGSHFHLYGLTGPTGGRALLLVGKRPPVAINFFSPQGRKHVLLYVKDDLGAGNHFAVLVVTGTHVPGSRGSYVNVDEVEIETGH